MKEEIAKEVLRAAATLRDAVEPLKFSPPVTHVYNPLNYAWAAHEQYVKKFANTPKRIVFLGMNPGPFGMAQTGVPFGEVDAVCDWMGIRTQVGKPRCEHPKRPVEGFDCPRSEVSGQRFWGMFATRFGSAEEFFHEHFVANYCPLAFLKCSGSNFTPDKLPKEEREELFVPCDMHLLGLIQVLKPEWLIGVGNFAFKHVQKFSEEMPALRVAKILHPSPACPHSNNDWTGKAVNQLQECGAWKA